jgi:hypothetical protein
LNEACTNSSSRTRLASTHHLNSGAERVLKNRSSERGRWRRLCRAGSQVRSLPKLFDRAGQHLIVTGLLSRVPDAVIATANGAGSPCDAIGSGLRARPAPWRSRPADKPARATSRVAGLWRIAEADLGAAAASQCDELEFQGGAVAYPEAEYGNDGGKKRIVIMPATVGRWRKKSPALLGPSEF